jgi:hypothetical protein
MGEGNSPKKTKKGQKLHDRDFKSLECVLNTHKSDFYWNFHPHSVILHAECDFHTHTSVILTLTSVIKTRSSGINTRTILASAHKVRFPHAEYDIHMQSVILHAECALTSVITTRLSVIYTCKV